MNSKEYELYLKRNIIYRVLKNEGEYDNLFQFGNEIRGRFSKINRGLSLETLVNLTREFENNTLILNSNYGDIFDGVKISGTIKNPAFNINNFALDMSIIYDGHVLTYLDTNDFIFNTVDNRFILQFRFTNSPILGYDPIYLLRIQYQHLILKFIADFSIFTNIKIEGIYIYFDILNNYRLPITSYITQRYTYHITTKNNLISFKYNYIITLDSTNSHNYITSITLHSTNPIMKKLFRILIYIDTSHIWTIERDSIIFTENINNLNTIRLEINKDYRYDLFLNNNVAFKLEFTTNNITENIDMSVTYEYLNELLYRNGIIILKRVGMPVSVKSIDNNWFLISNLQLLEIIREKTKPPNICPITHDEFVVGENIKMCDRCRTIYKENAINDWFRMGNKICPYARCEDVVWKTLQVPNLLSM
jgi:hypothetical protein